MIYFALPLASLAGEHIVFDLLDRVLPRDGAALAEGAVARADRG